MKTAQTMLRIHSFQSTVTSEWAGNTLPMVESTIAVPMSATTTLITRNPKNFSARGMPTILGVRKFFRPEILWLTVTRVNLFQGDELCDVLCGSPARQLGR